MIDNDHHHCYNNRRSNCSNNNNNKKKTQHRSQPSQQLLQPKQQSPNLKPNNNNRNAKETTVCLGCGPLPVTVTTRIITFLIGNPYNPSFTTVTVRGPYPKYVFFNYFDLQSDNFHDCPSKSTFFLGYSKTINCSNSYIFQKNTSQKQTSPASPKPWAYSISILTLTLSSIGTTRYFFNEIPQRFTPRWALAFGPDHQSRTFTFLPTVETCRTWRQPWRQPTQITKGNKKNMGGEGFYSENVSWGEKCSIYFQKGDFI